MSGFDSLLERLREAYAAASEMQVAARAAPGDQYVIANLGSVQRFAKQLESEWEAACSDRSLAVCSPTFQTPIHDR